MSRAARTAVWAFVGAALLFLYLPLLPPLLRTLETAKEVGLGGAFGAILADPILVGGIGNTLIIGALVAVLAPLLGLAMAQALRAWGRPRLVLGVVLLPLFIPGVSMGVATALFFRVLGIEPSLLSMTLVQVLWALPFATLVIMTVMSTFDRTRLEAAHMLGAAPLTAFLTVELPHIRPGLLGAGAFSLILSVNETIRTAMVQGGQNTVQTYLWSQYQQVGLSPALHALMTSLILVTLALMAVVAFTTRR